MHNSPRFRKGHETQEIIPELPQGVHDSPSKNTEAKGGKKRNLPPNTSGAARASQHPVSASAAASLNLRREMAGQPAEVPVMANPLSLLANNIPNLENAQIRSTQAAQLPPVSFGSIYQTPSTNVLQFTQHSAPHNTQSNRPATVFAVPVQIRPVPFQGQAQNPFVVLLDGVQSGRTFLGSAQPFTGSTSPSLRRQALGQIMGVPVQVAPSQVPIQNLYQRDLFSRQQQQQQQLSQTLSQVHPQVGCYPGTQSLFPSQGDRRGPQLASLQNPAMQPSRSPGIHDEGLFQTCSTRKHTGTEIQLTLPQGLSPTNLPPMGINHPQVPGGVPPYGSIGSLDCSRRNVVSMRTDEDQNWLSPLQCFIRSEIIEVYVATSERRNREEPNRERFGLRCRYCAQMPRSAKTHRSSAVPSCIEQIYQSFSMMLRDHFPLCKHIPSHVKDQFDALREKQAQGATDSTRFWSYSASTLGMFNAEDPNGIAITSDSMLAGKSMPPFGSPPFEAWKDNPSECIFEEKELSIVPPFLQELMSFYCFIRIFDVERIGARRNLPEGLAGIGCRSCFNHRRTGMSRLFPPRRKSLVHKIPLAYDHVIRCTLIPEESKVRLMSFEYRPDTNAKRGDKLALDLLWTKLKQHDCR